MSSSVVIFSCDPDIADFIFFFLWCFLAGIAVVSDALVSVLASGVVVLVSDVVVSVAAGVVSVVPLWAKAVLAVIRANVAVPARARVFQFMGAFSWLVIARG